MQSTNVITSDVDDGQSPKRELAIFTLARANGGVITDSTYGTKDIPVRGKIIGTGMTNVDALVDSFHAAMGVRNKDLDIAYNGSTRRYIATPARVTISRPVRGANWANFEVDFVVTEYGKDTTATTFYTNTSIATSGVTLPMTFGGSAPQQFLDIIVNVTAFDASNNGMTRSVTFTNPATTEALTVNRIWTAGEQLIIRNSDKSVKVNGALVDWSGAFHTYAPEVSSIVVTHNFTTSVTMTGTFDYIKRYL